MREIKFRMWGGDSKVMFCGIENAVECLKQQMYFNADNKDKRGYDHIGIHGSVFMQYTGLKDKYGKEIFEWDLVKHNNNIFEIKWNEREFCFIGRVVNDKGMNWRDLSWFKNVEKYIQIVGNIYESK